MPLESQNKILLVTFFLGVNFFGAHNFFFVVMLNTSISHAYMEEEKEKKQKKKKKKREHGSIYG